MKSRLWIRYCICNKNPFLYNISCSIFDTLQPSSAIDNSNDQSSDIPKEYTKQFSSVISWNKLSKHRNLSPSDAPPCQDSVVESPSAIPRMDKIYWRYLGLFSGQVYSMYYFSCNNSTVFHPAPSPKTFGNHASVFFLKR